MKLLEAEDVLVIVAHYDDEVLFCGGTLLELRDRGCRLDIAVVTNVADTNHGSNDEKKRKEMRIASFDAVLNELGARGFHLSASNYRGIAHTFVDILCFVVGDIAKLIYEIKPSVIITHGHYGEYGNWMHRLVHYAVRECGPEVMWSFDLGGSELVEIDWERKRSLIDLYSDSVVLNQKWRPYEQSAYQPWCKSLEAFDRSM